MYKNMIMSKNNLFSYRFADTIYRFLIYKAQHWIRTLKTVFDSFYVKFLKNDFSLDISSITKKFQGNPLISSREACLRILI